MPTEIVISLYAEDYQLANIIEYSSMRADLQNIEEEKILEDF